MKRRTIARIPIATLERHIGLHTAKRDYNAVEALRYLARDCMIELREAQINEHRDLVALVLNQPTKEDQTE